MTTIPFHTWSDVSLDNFITAMEESLTGVMSKSHIAHGNLQVQINKAKEERALRLIGVSHGPKYNNES